MVIRVNQLGYVSGCPKEADVMSTSRRTGTTFTVVDAFTRRVVLRGRLGRSHGAFNRRWAYVYRIDLTRVQRPGTYVIRVAGAVSTPVRIGSGAAIYRALTGELDSFFQAQRDGPDVIPGPLHRAPSHLLDEHAGVYAAPTYRGTTLVGRLAPTGAQIDVSGGWFDAGDYLKFVQTASFNDVMLLFAVRQYPGGLASPAAVQAEARFGTDWLLKMWDQSQRVLYYQVGIGDGNGSTILGDHDLWRLPQADDRRKVRPGSPAYFVSHRPVFAANAPGGPISPNLAGRVAAAFGLCAQVFAASDPAYAQRCLVAGETIYDLADTQWRGPLLASAPAAYYNEPEWRDDMALGAAELYLAVQQLGSPPGSAHPDPGYYLSAAGLWTDAYINSPVLRGDIIPDTLNLYDVSTLAVYDLVHILQTPQAQQLQAHDPIVNVPTDIPSLLQDRADQLALGAKLSRLDPFGLGNPSINVDTVPHALGYAIEARMYDELTGQQTFERLAQNQLAWVLGANPWGSSFIVGAGQVYPHCLAHQVANLSGSLTGRGRILRGAVVDGPNALSNLQGIGAPDGYRPCPANGRDPFRGLVGRRTGYLDDVRSPATSEPSDDYVALALLAAAQQAAAR